MLSFLALRTRLAWPRLTWQLCLLSLIGGFLASVVVILFNLAIEAIEDLYLTNNSDYTTLDALTRFDLPIIGALIILLFSWLTGYQYIRTGIPLVLHRLKTTYGVMPLKNTLTQFFGGIVSLSSGFSVGREGPVTHLGAACSSYIGTKLNLPYNSIRTLCASGIAAGIAACFNTPIAAVLFVMEVILREYEIHIFIPIMLAAIIGSMMTSSVFGPYHDFEFLSQIAIGFEHYPSLILLGVFLGIASAGFNRYIVATIKKFASFHIFTRIMLAAVITGSLGVLVPSAMGTGTTAINFSLEHSLQMQILFGLLAAKMLMTMAAIGLGVPGGVVGPIISIGAVAGVCGAVVFGKIFPAEHIASDFALMGMAGFMAATLNAPLAALLAVVELSNQLEIILPAMVVIATASMISGQLFKNRSLFLMQLDIQQLAYRKPPIETSLQKVGVLAQMNTNFQLVTADDYIEPKHPTNHDRVVIEKHDYHTGTEYVWLEQATKVGVSDDYSTVNEHQLIPLNSQATLAEAYLALLDKREGGVYIYETDSNDMIGVITFNQIRNYLLQGKII